MRHNQISRQNKNKKIKYLAIGLAAGVLGIGSAAGVLTSANSHAVNRSASSSTQDTDQITYKGVTYVPKGNLETYLFAGIDSPDKVTEIKEYDGTGQCDVLLVLVRDRSTDTCKFLTIDRNTMTCLLYTSPYRWNPSSQTVPDALVWHLRSHRSQ